MVKNKTESEIETSYATCHMFLRQHIDRCVDHNVRLPDFEATGKTFYSNAFITQF